MNPFLIILSSVLLAAGVAEAQTNSMRALAVNGRIVVTELNADAGGAEFDTGWATWSQRGELIGRGQMTDSQGRRYNVRILPGYVAPWHFAGEGWGDAGSNVGEYFEYKTWANVADDSGDCFKWGWKDSLWEFGLKDSGSAWTSRFASAAMRTKKKTFGWPIAYPWAFLSATVESVVRIPIGAVGAVLGTGAGVVVPVVETVWPTAKGVWNAGIEGTVLPVAGWAWNTVAAPPAALLASAPNPSRTDGVWMHVMNEEEIRRERGGGNFSDDESLARLAAYGREIEAELAASGAQRGELRKQQEAEYAEIRKRFDAEFRKLTTNETERLNRWLADASNEALVVKLAQDGWDSRKVRSVRAELIERLVASGATKAEAERIATRLSFNPPASKVPGAYDNKTDPAMESYRIIKDTTDFHP